MLQANVCNGQEVCQFLSLFVVCTLLESKIFEDHFSNVNISLTVGRIFTKIYIFILGLFRKPGKLGSHTGQNDDPVTR